MTLLKIYIFVSTFRCLFAEHYSFHFLNIFAVYILQMICIAIIFIQMIKNDQMGEMIFYGVNILYLTVRLLFLCYWCQKVNLEVWYILYSLRIRTCKLQHSSGIFEYNNFLDS